MAEIKLPRLLAAAKEFNIGQDTLIDFLIGKSFPKDELKPTSKLTEAMYRALQLEFQGDKAAKMKSDQVDLPKGSLAEAKKKKEDEEILFKKEEKKAAAHCPNLRVAVSKVKIVTRRAFAQPTAVVRAKTPPGCSARPPPSSSLRVNRGSGAPRFWRSRRTPAGHRTTSC